MLWTFVGEQDPRARLDAAMYFFEAVARYLGVVLLSGLRNDRRLYLLSRPSWQGNGAPPSVVMRRSTIGSWVRFDMDMAKALRRQLHDDPGPAALAFGLVDSAPLASVCSKALMAVLSEAVLRRNEWRGHDAGVSIAERRHRVAAMADLIGDLRIAAAGALDEWELFKPRSLQTIEQGFVVDAHVFDGPKPRMRTKSMRPRPAGSDRRSLPVDGRYHGCARTSPTDPGRSAR